MLQLGFERRSARMDGSAGNVEQAQVHRRGAAAARAQSVEAAAIAGLVFLGAWIVARMLLLRTPEPSDPDLTAWYADTAHQQTTLTALNLTSIGSVSFLWFVAVIRRRIAQREDPFFGTVFFGSALITVVLIDVGVLLYSVPALDSYFFGTAQSAAGVAAWQSAGLATLQIVAVRFEAVFMISAASVARRSGVAPRALVVLGYLAGLLMLLAPLPTEFLAWVFPVWVGLASCMLLVRRHQVGAEPT